MTTYCIDIDDEMIKEQMSHILSKILEKELKHTCTNTGEQISLAVKDLIYSHKDEIIDKVISRATTEIVKKGLPKLLERGVAE